MSLMGFPASPNNGDVYQLWTYDTASSHWHITASVAGTVWDEIGSDIHYSSGKVAVKTTTFTHDLTVNGVAGFSGGAVADLTGDIKATNGTKILENGTNGTDALLTGNVTGDVKGDIKATDGTKILENGANLAGAQFYGKVDGGTF